MTDGKWQPIEVGELDRKTYIGGSRVSAVLGLDPYGKTPLTEYESIISEQEGKIDPEREKFFAWRKEWEPIVIKRIEREFDAKIVAVNKRYRDPEHKFLAAELDFEWLDPTTGLIENGEIKTVHPLAFNERGGWGEAGTADVPVNYSAQCMHGLGVMGRRKTVLVAMAGIDTFVHYNIERDDEVIAAMRARCVSFWIDNVLARLPPDPVSLDDCMRAMKRLRGKPVEADEQMYDWLTKLKALRETANAMEGEESELKFNIALAVLRAWGYPDPELALPGVKDNALITHAGAEIATWNAQSTARIDAKALRKEKPDIAALFTKSTISRVLRFKK